MNYRIDGWYAKFGEIYKPKTSRLPFLTPWEVFDHYETVTQAAYLKKGKEVLVIESKSRLRLPGL